MAIFKSNKITYKQPALTPMSAGQVVAERQSVAVPSTLALNDIVAFCELPAGCVPVDGYLVSTDLDTGTPTITLTVGVLDAAGTDLVASTDFLTASTVAQAGGVARFDKAAGLGLAASASDRIIAVKVAAAAATGAAGTLTLVLEYKYA